MKRILLAAWFAFIAASASAADLAPVYRKAPVTPIASWTGFYAGLNAGYGFNDPTVTTTGADPISNIIVGIAGGFPQISYGMNSVIGGGQIGYNWQTAPNWIAGLEADFQGANLHGSGSGQIPSLIAGPSGFLSASQDLKWFGTVRGRVGYLANDRLMIFGTGGLAYGEVKDALTVGYNIPIANNAAIAGFAVTCTATNNCYNGASSKIQVGYAAGGGIEYAAWQNVTLKVEYMYVNLGTGNLTSVSNPSTAGLLPSILSSHFTDLYFNVVRAGVNWRF